MSWSRKDIMADIKKREYRLCKIEYTGSGSNARYIEHDDPELDKLPYWELRNAYVGCCHAIELRSGGHGHGGGYDSRQDDYRPPDS